MPKPPAEQQQLFPTGQQVLDALREFERQKIALTEMLQPLLLEIVRQRHPVGSIMQVRGGRAAGVVLSGHLYGMQRGKVLYYRNENIDLNRPEDTRVGVIVKLLKAEDVETMHNVTVWVDAAHRFCDSERQEEIASLVNRLNDSRLK